MIQENVSSVISFCKFLTAVLYNGPLVCLLFMTHSTFFLTILDGGLGLQRCMAGNLGEELDENYKIEEIEEIIFVANENMKNQSHPACQPIQPVDKTLWVR